MSVKYCDEHVCLTVCLSVCLDVSKTTHPDFTEIFCYVLTVGVPHAAFYWACELVFTRNNTNRVYDFTKTFPLCCVLMNNGRKESRHGSHVDSFFFLCVYPFIFTNRVSTYFV